jgi:cytidylate kinase
VAPLKQADDAVRLDTTELNFQESEAALLDIIKEKAKA